jgi:hypothetical protein
LKDTWLSFAVEPSQLTNGTNTLAIEVHQASVSSADLSFDFQLIATLDASAIIPPELNVTRLGNGSKLSWPAAAAGYVLEGTDELGAGNIWSAVPGPVQILSDQFFVTNGVSAGARFHRLRNVP